MSEDLINYGELIDDAMHLIVKKALKLAALRPLPGDHHFFISFVTKYPGVSISNKLLEKYPNEMTIVLQFQFEELIVEEDYFSVILSFGGVKEKLVIPFASLTAFADPSVKFGLQFRYAWDKKEEVDDLPKAEITKFNSLSKNTAQPKEVLNDSSKPVDSDNVITLDKFRKKSTKPKDKP
jgi:hypothetical protein